jgi:hypothetical protein
MPLLLLLLLLLLLMPWLHISHVLQSHLWETSHLFKFATLSSRLIPVPPSLPLL